MAGYWIHKSVNSETPAPVRTETTTQPELEIKSFLCPITQEMMKDPWACPYCQSFEKSAIISWLERSPECPMCCRPIRVEDLKPNLNLRSAIEEYRRIHSLP